VKTCINSITGLLQQVRTVLRIGDRRGSWHSLSLPLLHAEMADNCCDDSPDLGCRFSLAGAVLLQHPP
jgi:hypothetical protein